MDKNFNLLIVDDEVVTLKLTKQGLEKLGYNVAIFSKPEESLVYFKENHSNVHLIISDKSMPKMRGIELLKEIRKIDKVVPFFILTGYTTREDDELLVQEGVTKILMKPLSLKELVREIKDNLTPKA